MRTTIAILSFLFVSLLAQDASAAVKYKRYPHCPEGPVTMATCECHIGTTGHFHYCHAGQFCHSLNGACRP